MEIMTIFTKYRRYFPWILVIIGLILTAVSDLGICTTACSKAKQWRFFGFSFNTLGYVFFASVLAVLSLGTRAKGLLILLTGSAVGAEAYFQFIQYQSSGVCPICVLIAICTVLLFISCIFSGTKGEKMKSLLPKSGIAMFLGFLIAFVGAVEFNPLEAKIATVGNKLALGNKGSNIEVYVFSDWFCPHCIQTEPFIEDAYSALQTKAKFYFVDIAINADSMNFIPYHISFAINNKDKYLELRKALHHLSIHNQTPSDEDIESLVAKVGANFKELPYSTVSQAMQFNKKLTNNYEIRTTPTVVVKKNSKIIKLVGHDEIKTLKKTVNAM